MTLHLFFDAASAEARADPDASLDRIIDRAMAQAPLAPGDGRHARWLLGLAEWSAISPAHRSHALMLVANVAYWADRNHARFAGEALAKAADQLARWGARRKFGRDAA